MAAGRTGSLETLRRLNRLRVIDALRDEGLISRAEIARRTGLSRSTVSSLVADLQADGLVVERAEPGAAHGDQGGRPPILLSFDALGRRRRRHRLRPPPPARRGLATSRRTILAERERAARHRPRRRRRASTRPPSSSTSCSPRPGVDDGAGDRRRHGACRARSTTTAGVVGSTAILPGWVGVAAADEMQPPARPPGPRRQRRQPRRARRGRRSAPGATRATLVYVKISSGIGAGLIAQRPPVPRRARASPASSATCSSTRDGPDLPLRQPRLPGDARRHGPRSPTCCAAATATASTVAAIVRAGPRRRPRLPARDRRRRARDRPGGGGALQRAQPGDGRRRRRPRATAGDLLLDRVRESVEPVRAPGGRGGGRRRRGRARRARRGARRARARPLARPSATTHRAHGGDAVTSSEEETTPMRRRNHVQQRSMVRGARSQQ